MATCKAVIQEGPRKGQACQFPPSNSAYCGRHDRNRIYDEGLQAGKHWCRFFFRGCDTELNAEEVSKKEVSCKGCRERLTKKKHSCNHVGCLFKVAEPGFCKKHVRDQYKKEEEEKGIIYCDIARGCFTICTDGKKSCEECLTKTRIVDNTRYMKRKELTQQLQATTHTTKRVCTQCGKDYESFKTRYGKESVKCARCNTAQATQDEKRKDRIRNFKEEKCRNIPQYYKDYVKGSTKRGYEMNLDFDTFSGLVSAECHYCGHKTEGEVNGIDRVDNSRGYSVENCVTACWKCNRIKHIYHKDFFIEKCILISKMEHAPLEFFNRWSEYYNNTSYRSFNIYKKDSEKRKLTVDLTESEWANIIRSPCYLCGYKSTKANGIDRVDNTIRAYTLSNSRACCRSCNTMKGEIELDDLIQHCSLVANRITPQETVVEEEPASERKHWKAVGLYYAIISDSAADFLDLYSSVYSSGEFNELSRLIKESTKEQGVKTLKTLLQTLRKRRQRSEPRSKNELVSA